MQIGKWYQQVFSDKTIYFLVQRIQVNGNYAGIQVDSYPGSKPKAKKSSVPKGIHSINLWSAVTEIPQFCKDLVPSDNG